MTLENLLALARAQNDDLGKAVIDLLGEAQPCGFESPVVDAGEVVIPRSWLVWLSADDARALGRMLFAAADRADKR